jgi:hypothetical protein
MVAPKIFNQSAGLAFTPLFNHARRMPTMGVALSLVPFSLSRTIGDEREKSFEREDAFMVEMVDLCDRPKVRRNILVELSVISPYRKP